MFAAIPAPSSRPVDELREEMVKTLVEKGVAFTPGVIQALRVVPWTVRNVHQPPHQHKP